MLWNSYTILCFDSVPVLLIALLYKTPEAEEIRFPAILVLLVFCTVAETAIGFLVLNKAMPGADNNGNVTTNPMTVTAVSITAGTPFVDT